VVPAPESLSRHWSDTDLVLHEGRLHLLFRGCERGGGSSEFLLSTSADGVSWSEPVEVWFGGDGAVSPSLVHEDGTWSLWHIECAAPKGATASVLVRHSSTDLRSWSAAEPCSLDIPGHDGGYEALVSAFPAGSNPSRCQLFHVVSADGVTFELSSARPVIAPSMRRWSNRMVYRSTFDKAANGTYRIWYSGASWGMRCGIGYAEGPLDALRFVDGPRATGVKVRLREDLRGWADHVAQHKLPAPVKKLIRSVLPQR
jgi:hypothetical protein